MVGWERLVVGGVGQPAVGGQGGVTAHGEETVEGGFTIEQAEQALVVVSQDRDQFAVGGEADQAFDDARAISASVDVVAQGDHLILAQGSICLDESVEGIRTAVDIADGDGTPHSGRLPCRAIRPS